MIKDIPKKSAPISISNTELKKKVNIKNKAEYTELLPLITKKLQKRIDTPNSMNKSFISQAVLEKNQKDFLVNPKQTKTLKVLNIAK